MVSNTYIHVCRSKRPRLGLGLGLPIGLFGTCATLGLNLHTLPHEVVMRFHLRLFQPHFGISLCITCKDRLSLQSHNDNQPSNIFPPTPDGDPSNYLTYFKRAAVYLAMGQAKKALPDLDSCITIKPDFHHVREDGEGFFFLHYM